MKSGSCIVFVSADLAYGVMNFASDLMIAILPIRMVWGLNRTKGEKVGLSLVFLSGLM